MSDLVGNPEDRFSHKRPIYNKSGLSVRKLEMITIEETVVCYQASARCFAYLCMDYKNLA